MLNMCMQSSVQYGSENEYRPAIPRLARIGFTVWMIIWTPVILWAYGPQNFLWLCNLAQFLILYSVWTENRLILSSQTGLLLAVGTGWTLDFVIAVIFSGSITGFTGYMFDPEIPFTARIASLYHVFVPVFAVWLCLRIGYDSRGFPLQCVIGAAALIASWLLTEEYRNVNWVYSPFGIDQVWAPQAAYVGLLILLYPLILYLPGHGLMLVAQSYMQRRHRGSRTC